MGFFNGNQQLNPDEERERKDISEKWVWRALTYFANLVLLNLLFLLCSLPVITIGVSYGAMHTQLRKMKEGEDVVVVGFFRAFADQFKQTTISWGLFLIPGIWLMMEANMLIETEAEVPVLIYVSLIVPSIVYLALLPWVLIQASYFTCTTAQQIKNSLLFAVRLLPQTIVMVILELFPLYVFLMKTVAFFRVWPLWLFLYFSASGMIVVNITRIPMARLKMQLSEREDD